MIPEGGDAVVQVEDTVLVEHDVGLLVQFSKTLCMQV